MWGAEIVQHLGRRRVLALVGLMSAFVVFAASTTLARAAQSPIVQSQVVGDFYTTLNNNGGDFFKDWPGGAPLWSQSFASINFNDDTSQDPPGYCPPPQGYYTRPFTDGVSLNPPSNTECTYVAAQNPSATLAAGVDESGDTPAGPDLEAFTAVFTGAYTVAGNEDVTFDSYSDDGFALGIGASNGNQPSYVSGALSEPSGAKVTGVDSYPIVGADDGPNSPTGNTFVVHFPAAGTYPFELDYDECCGFSLEMKLDVGGAVLQTQAASSTALTCVPTSLDPGSPTTCTATVTNAVPSSPTAPTGTVSFSASPATGRFAASGTCTLAAAGPPGASSCQTTFTPSAGGAYTITAAYAGDIGDAASQATAVLAVTTPISATTAPRLTGTARAGGKLVCSTGTWSGGPIQYAFAWYRNGTQLAGVTGASYRPGTLDGGSTIRCEVTASNSQTSGSAQSNTVTVAVVAAKQCPAATGRMTGEAIGRIRLGMTRPQARGQYKRYSVRGKGYQDVFCLNPTGITAGYASPALLTTLPRAARAGLRGVVAWASTANPHYALDGIRAGEALDRAEARLPHGTLFHIGGGSWYLVRAAHYTAVLKVRGRAVQELGITTNEFTSSRSADRVLLRSFA